MSFVTLLHPVGEYADMGYVGLFLGSGRSLASAGPGGAVVAYILMGTGEQLLPESLAWCFGGAGLTSRLP